MIISGNDTPRCVYCEEMFMRNKFWQVHYTTAQS